MYGIEHLFWTVLAGLIYILNYQFCIPASLVVLKIQEDDENSMTFVFFVYAGVITDVREQIFACLLIELLAMRDDSEGFIATI